MDLFDIFCVLNAFSGQFSATCTLANADLAPCAQDGMIDLFDIFAVLDAFGGTDKCGCGLESMQSTITDTISCTITADNLQKNNYTERSRKETKECVKGRRI